MKIAPLLSTLVLLTFGASLAAEPSDHGGDFAGTYIATLPERTEIFQLHGDGTAEITLSDQVTPGARGPRSATASAPGRGPDRGGSSHAS